MRKKKSFSGWKGEAHVRGMRRGSARVKRRILGTSVTRISSSESSMEFWHMSTDLVNFLSLRGLFLEEGGVVLRLTVTAAADRNERAK